MILFNKSPISAEIDHIDKIYFIIKIINNFINFIIFICLTKSVKINILISNN